MRPILRALLGVCMVAGAASAIAAQEPRRNDRLAIVPDTVRRTLAPGSIATVRVAVQELAGAAQSFVVHTTVPDGWRLLSQPVTTPLPAKGRAFRLVQFQVPADAEAGEYAVVHAVRAPGLDTDLETRTSVVVTLRRSLSVALVDEPIFAASGSRFHTSFLVTNNGNARTKVRLRVRTEPGISATPDTISELKPGESRTVGVDVDAGRATNGEELMRHVALIADADGGGALDDGPAKPAAAANVRIVPRSASADAPWFALPALLRLSRTQGGGAAHSFELAGGGALADGSSTTVDFFARGPQPAQSFFSERDEYRVAVTSKTFSMRLGDQIYRLSPLTDLGSFSSGFSFSGTRGDWTAGAEAGRDRWNPFRSSQRSAFVKFDPTPAFSIAANAMQSDRVRNGTIGTLYLRAMPSAHSFLELERGVGLAGDGTGAAATMMRLAGDQGWIAFDARAVRSDSGYLTTAMSGTQALANFTVRPASWLRLGGHTYMEPTRQTSEFTVDLTRRLAAGLRTSSRTADSGPIALPAQQSIGVEQSAWVRLAATAGRLNAIATFERGTLDRRSEKPIVPFSTSRIQAGLRVTSAASIGGFVERTTGQRLFMIEPATVVTAGASASLQIGPMSVAVVGNAAPASRFRIVPDSLWMLPGSTASIDAAIGYALSNGRSISLRVHTSAAGPGRPAMSVARIGYEMPLRLPIGRSRTVSRVMGRVYDDETGAGVPNALVRLGDRLALTDDDGRVAFGGLAPSRYPVRVDLGALEAAGAGTRDRLLEVDALAGRTTDLGIRVTHMGRIAGTLSLFERIAAMSLNAPDSARMRRMRGLGGVLVTFVNGGEERRVLSRPDGSFELRDARPGVWRVIVASDQLPRDHAVEGDSIRVVDLAAGGSKQLDLRVTPRARTILPLDAPPIAPPPAPAPAKTVIPLREPVARPVPVVAPVVSVAARAPAKRTVVAKPKPRVAPTAAIELSANAWPFVPRYMPPVIVKMTVRVPATTLPAVTFESRR